MQAKVYEYFKEKNDCELLICEDDKEAIICCDIVNFAGTKAFRLPDFRACYGDDLRSYSSELLELSNTLSSFYKCKDKKVLISPYHTLLHKLPAKKHIQTMFINFGDELNLNSLGDELIRFGYESVDIVEEKGEFSFRGDVIDIFSVCSNEPIRILLFDNEVESIRKYSPSTQLSLKDELESVEITPYIAYLNSDEVDKVNKNLEDIGSDSILKDISSLGFWAIEDFIDYTKVFNSKLVKDAEFIQSSSHASKFKDFEILPQAKEYKELQVTINSDFFDLNKNKKIEILAKNESMYKALNVKHENVKFVQSPYVISIKSKTHIIYSLNSFQKKQRVKKASLVIDELKINDYIVHEDYGIGRFLGLEKIKVLGSTKEFVAIGYQNEDKLLLPVENLNLIDRYIAQSGSLAIMDRLGKATFTKIKEKVRQKLFIIASKIISIAAQRELLNGKVIDKNDLEYLKFVNSAGFEYTKDQALSVDEIMSDLKSGKVMDRLLSGDVGFGKTEVAMNAIFACVKSGFQSLFFVPTTLLSSQHYKTLKERFASFDIDIFRLDRFSTSKQKATIIKALEDGKPCVCVGTHSLLSVKASNMGLMVVDEEHKFGVKQKEKLKEISSTAHLLSMSATPIPRSLNMALSKIKSYSTLKTPPSSRLDVRTIVKEYDEKVVKEAIMRELRRGGQIFYIHNHIADMMQTAKALLEILPKLRILILHSKINAKTTEEEMAKFENREYDLLLCTSIVESGIHLPNVNTIIVENSNKFGIADLHQLRGRVGRNNRQGYCYLLVEDSNALTKDALKRLVALESNSSLGSGAVLAYHDLEIRGGGNIVGEAQSGHIEAIGYTLYLKMLEDEINKLLNQNEIKRQNIDIKLSISAFLNPDFIHEDRLRLELYRRLSKCDDVSEVFEISGEIEDRFGKIDKFTNQFLQLIMIKILGSKLEYKSISNADQNIVITDKNDGKIRLKSRSKDDDDIIDEILLYLRKNKK